MVDILFTKACLLQPCFHVAGPPASPSRRCWSRSWRTRRDASVIFVISIIIIIISSSIIIINICMSSSSSSIIIIIIVSIMCIICIIITLIIISSSSSSHEGDELRSLIYLYFVWFGKVEGR